MKEPLAIIATNDTETILRLYKRACLLSRVCRISQANGSLSANMVNDLKNAELELSNYWNNLAEKYNLKKSSEGRWTIDFQTNKIYLIS